MVSTTASLLLLFCGASPGGAFLTSFLSTPLTHQGLQDTVGRSSGMLFPELHPGSAKLHLTTTKARLSNGDEDCQPFADIIFDRVCKRVFTDEEVLRGFLNDVGVAGAGCNVSSIDQVELRAAHDVRAVIFDIHCTVVNITSMATSRVHFELHVALPWSQIYDRMVYPESCSEDTYSPSALERGQEAVRPLFVQLPLPPTVLTDDADDVERWAYLISQSGTLKEIPGPLEKEVFRRALELAKVSQMPFMEQTYYLKWKKDQAIPGHVFWKAKAERVAAELVARSAKALRDAERRAEQAARRAEQAARKLERLERELAELKGKLNEA